MIRSEHPIDDEVRRLPFMTDDQVARSSDEATKQALLDRILAVATSDEHPRRPGPRRSQRSIVLAATLTLLSAGAVGWAVVSITAGDSTDVACHLPDGSISIIDASTGDPVMDCGGFWEQQLGPPVPPLVAYDNGRGGIEVVPPGAAVPNDWHALQPGVVQDPRLVELESALDDEISGLAAECYPAEDALSIAERQLDRLGLTQWSVTHHRHEADGQATCSSAYVDAHHREVVIFPVASMSPSDGAPYELFAQDLAATLNGRCLDLSQAAMHAARIAAAAGVEDLVLHEIPDEGVTCARAVVNVGGRVQATIRGPKGAP